MEGLRRSHGNYEKTDNPRLIGGLLDICVKFEAALTGKFRRQIRRVFGFPCWFTRFVMDASRMFWCLVTRQVQVPQHEVT